jgi:hypothetical protein
MSDQLDFDFSNSATGQPGFSESESGHAIWREERRAAQEALAAKMGLPLGKRVRVEFANGPELPSQRDQRLHPTRLTADAEAAHRARVFGCPGNQWASSFRQ